MAQAASLPERIPCVWINLEVSNIHQVPTKQLQRPWMQGLCTLASVAVREDALPCAARAATPAAIDAMRNRDRAR